MNPTTPKPPKDVLEVLPELAKQSVTAVRLHPRRGEVARRAASKIGGTFLWPTDEPWPVCDEPTCNDPGVPEPRLVPVLQLRSSDVPVLKFFPGTDLLQLLWYSEEHDGVYAPKPFVFWRNPRDVARPRRKTPRPDPGRYEDDAYELEEGFLPRPCRLYPERVTEYPHIDTLTAGQRARLNAWDVPDARARYGYSDPATFYKGELSVCPCLKVGGYVHWVQNPRPPRCGCRRKMSHLLTLTAEERWRTTGLTRKTNTTGLGMSGCLFVFICRSCRGWPVKSSYQV